MICALCPRDCHAVRTERDGGGVCGMPSRAVVAKAMTHRWEEPCLTGEHGAGAVFFAGCSLQCGYCQNRAISRPGGAWKPVDTAGLRGIFRDLIARGAACLDLVTPTHFTPFIREALRGEDWPLPVVWNSSGYEKVETLRTLETLVQVYMPELKYALPGPAERYSGASDYFRWAAPAILEMFRQTGPYRMERGQLVSGVLVRHLILPGEMENTRRVIDWLSRTFRPGDVLFSLMRQYTPQPGAAGNLARRVTGGEYRAAVAYAQNCGITDGYTQDAASAVADYTPDF